MELTATVLMRLVHWATSPRHRLFKAAGMLIGVALALFLLNQTASYVRWLEDPRSRAFWQWAQGEEAARAELITAQRDSCSGAPFILPTDGFIGLLYGDPRGPYSAANPHQGIDIFSVGAPGVTPVYAAYDGYLTREENWRSSLIIRVPDDPLQPGRTLWLYYTHLADRQGNDFIVDAFLSHRAPQNCLWNKAHCWATRATTTAHHCALSGRIYTSLL